MRLLLVIDALISGGAQRQLVSLACGLARLDAHVEVLTYHPEHRFFENELADHGIRLHLVRKRRRYSADVVRALRRLMRSNALDGVISFLTAPNVYAELSRVGLPRAKRPVLIVSERNRFAKEAARSKTWLFRQLHRFADHVTTNTHAHAALLTDAYPWLAGRVSTIYNGVDLDRFHPPKERIISDGQPLQLLAVGSVIARKNASLVLQALADYRARHGTLPFQLRWAGRQPDNADGRQTFAAAEKLRHSLNLGDAWTWLGERADVAELIRDCDALIHPGDREGLPNAICEALASGRPVLAADIADNARLLDSPRRGLTFAPHASGELVAALHRFASSPAAEREAMGRAARGFAETHLGLTPYARAYHALVTRLLAERGGEHRVAPPPEAKR